MAVALGEPASKRACRHNATWGMPKAEMPVPNPSTTFGKVAADREARFFVGRQRELATFAEWMNDGAPVILTLSGPSGIGKSALMSAFHRQGEALGRPVIHVNAGDFQHTVARL